MQLETILTPHGPVEIVNQLTIGDIAIVTVLSLHLTFGLLKWLFETLWRGGRR